MSFLATLKAWEELDLEVAGDFILMAARCWKLKPKWSHRRRGDDEEEDENPLIRVLA